MRIGFDLDGVFIDKPPIVPKWLIEFLYRSPRKELSYRYPSHTEKLIRKWSHIPLLRPPFTYNIRVLQNNWNHNSLFFLISSRYSFLEKETAIVIHKYNLLPFFQKVIINERDKQPHIYKNAMLKRFKIDRYVDDDLPLLIYLSQKNPSTIFFHLNNKRNRQLKKNLIAITNVSKVFS